MVPTCLTKCARVPGFPYNSVCFSYELSISPPVLTIVLISPADMPGAPKPSIQWTAEEVLGGCGNFSMAFPSQQLGFSVAAPQSFPSSPSLDRVVLPCAFLSACFLLVFFHLLLSLFFLNTVSFEFFLKIILVESY